MPHQEGFWAFQGRAFGCFVLTTLSTLWIPFALGFSGPVVGAWALLNLVLFNILKAKTDPDRVRSPAP